MSFRIEYRNADDLLASTDHPGPLQKAENKAIIGLLRYLASGVELARIIDEDGKEALVIFTPRITSE